MKDKRASPNAALNLPNSLFSPFPMREEAGGLTLLCSVRSMAAKPRGIGLASHAFHCDIHLLVLTHGHWDHIASSRAIKELTGAPIAIHYREKVWLVKSLKPNPPGVTPWGHIVISVIEMSMPFVHIPATDVNIVLRDTEVSLADYGIPGKIIPTLGHSSGSVSILLDSGEAFVGDLAMNWLPLRLTPGLPIFAENTQVVRESWKMLIARGAKTVYPAHGKPFSADIIQKALSD